MKTPVWEALQHQLLCNLVFLSQREQKAENLDWTDFVLFLFLYFPSKELLTSKNVKTQLGRPFLLFCVLSDGIESLPSKLVSERWQINGKKTQTKTKNNYNQEYGADRVNAQVRAHASRSLISAGLYTHLGTFLRGEGLEISSNFGISSLYELKGHWTNLKRANLILQTPYILGNRNRKALSLRKLCRFQPKGSKSSEDQSTNITYRNVWPLITKTVIKAATTGRSAIQ